MSSVKDQTLSFVFNLAKFLSILKIIRFERSRQMKFFRRLTEVLFSVKIAWCKCLSRNRKV